MKMKLNPICYGEQPLEMVLIEIQKLIIVNLEQVF